MRPSTITPVRIGPAVRRHRLSAGLTQAQLAELTGIADETLSRIETGRMPQVSMDLCSRLAAALGVTPKDLLQDATAPRATELRPGERALLALAARLDDAALADLVRSIRLMVGVARRIVAPVSPQRSRKRQPSHVRRRA